MSAEYWNTPLDHTSDTGYRAWGAELHAKLAAHGLVQTADTGQIDWTSVTRPAGNTYNGYEIWRFDDTMQGTAPIFIRLDFGTSATNAPQIKGRVGQGSDGAGTITGLMTPERNVVSYRYGTYNGGSYPSWLCVADGFFGLGWKSSADYGSGILISRVVGANGVPNGDGFEVRFFDATTVANNAACYCVSNVTNTIYTAAASATALLPYGLASTVVGVVPQVMKTYLVTPRVRPNAFVLFVRSGTEIPTGTQFLSTVVGGVQRTYVALPENINGANWLATGGRMAMLFE